MIKLPEIDTSQFLIPAPPNETEEERNARWAEEERRGSEYADRLSTMYNGFAKIERESKEDAKRLQKKVIWIGILSCLTLFIGACLFIGFGFPLIGSAVFIIFMISLLIFAGIGATHSLMK